MTGVVQHYAWGDTTFLPELLGRTADGRPWAELWFGTHRGGPATLDGDVSLLGTSGELPYLLTLAGHGFYWFRFTPPEGGAS